MKKTILYLSIILIVLTFSQCQNNTAHIDEQFGQGIILQQDSAVLFFKGLTFFPEEKKIDSTKLKTKLNLYLYKPYTGETELIKKFDQVKNWPGAWETFLDYNGNYIGFSLNNIKNKKLAEEEGIYLYDRNKKETNKIEEVGTKFWMSPDYKLIIYHLFDEESNSYQLYGYDTEEKKRSLFEEAQPKIKNVEWLKKGEAALLMTEKEDSTILVEFKEQKVK